MPSTDERHIDRNFGSVLSIWDWACGTIYVPQGREELTFGLVGEHAVRHDTLAQAWLGPLRDQLLMLVGRRPAVAAVALPLLAFALPACPTPELEPPPETDDDDDDAASNDDDDAAPCDDEWEPNDTPKTAPPTGITWDVTSFGDSVLCAGDVDWYRMTLAPADGVDIGMGAPEGSELAMSRHDADGNLVESAMLGRWPYMGVGNEFDCEGDAPKGTEPLEILIRVEAPKQAGPVEYSWEFEEWNCDE